MDSLAQSYLWLVWEMSPEAVLPADQCPSARGQTSPQKAAASFGGRSMGLATGVIILGSSLLGTHLAAPAGANSRAFGSTIYVNTPSGYALNVRWGPSTNNGVYRRVRRGSALQVSGRHSNGWVQLVDATWVAGNLVSPDPVGGVEGGFDPGD
ncbi:MAG TPA: SH3 domain-containing protein, partial [Nodosilinea sp.]|nr:SH3 domain-containing protein [Nodosilinea sp.]